MEWEVNKGNPDSERRQLNRVLEEIENTIIAIPGGVVDTVVGGAGVDVDSTDPANPIVNLDASTIADLALAASAVQPGDNVSVLVNDAGYTTNLGTVTSVDLGATTGLTPSGGPVTGAGVLAYTLSANLQAWHGLATSAKQDSDTDLTTIAGLAPANDDILQRKAGAWTHRTVAQYKIDQNYQASEIDVDTTGWGELLGPDVQTALDVVDLDLQIQSAAISGKQNLDATLTALAAADWVANAVPIGSGADTVAQVSFAANTFPARASTGNLVAKTVTDSALTILSTADALTAGIVNQQAYRITDYSMAFGSLPAFISSATGATGQPLAENFAGIYVPFSTTANVQFVIRADRTTPSAHIRAGQGSIWGNFFQLALRGNSITTATTAAAINPNIDNFDIFERSAQTVNLTINAPTGTVQDGMRIRFRIRDNGTPRTLTWNAVWLGTFVALPGTTVANKWMYLDFEYNASVAQWHLLRVLNQL